MQIRKILGPANASGHAIISTASIVDLANTYKELFTNANTTFSGVTNRHSDTSTLNQLVDDLMSDSTILGARIDLMVTDIMNISDYFNTTQVCWLTFYF